MNEWKLLGYVEASIEDAVRMMARYPAKARTRLKNALKKIDEELSAPHAAGLRQFHSETLERLRAMSDPDILVELALDDAALIDLNELACKLVYQTEQILHERMAGAKMAAFEDAFGDDL